MAKYKHQFGGGLYSINVSALGAAAREVLQDICGKIAAEVDKPIKKFTSLYIKDVSVTAQKGLPDISDVAKELSDLFFEMEDGEWIRRIPAFADVAYKPVPEKSRGTDVYRIEVILNDAVAMTEYATVMKADNLNEYVAASQLRGKYTLRFYEFMREKMPSDGVYDVDFEELRGYLGFSPKYRSTAILAKLDEAIKDIKDIAMYADVSYEAHHSDFWASSRRKGKVESLTFTVRYINMYEQQDKNN